MKYNYWFLLCVFLLNHNFTFSQTHQIYGSVGYNFPTATGTIGKTHIFDTNEVTNTSFSEGPVIQAGYSYMIINNLLLDVSVNYLFGVSNKTYYSSVEQIPPSNEYIERTKSFSNSNFSISPSIVMRVEIGKFKPYIKFGGSINFIRVQVTWQNPPSSSQIFPFRNLGNRYYVYNYKGGFTLGWLAGVGINYLLGSTQLFCELQLNSMTFYPDEVEFSISGTDYKLTYELKDELDPLQPATETSAVQDFPFS